MRTNELSLTDALELMVFCNHLGQIDQKSNFETRLYDEICKKVIGVIKDPEQLCIIWLFLRSWGPSGRDLLEMSWKMLSLELYHIIYMANMIWIILFL